jgi:hypothetical protein
MGVGMVANAIAFAVGLPAQMIPWREVRRSLKSGYLPVVISTWRKGSLLFKQTSFASLLGPRAVQSGHEKQVAVVEMNISNTSNSETQQESLWVFVPGVIAAKGVPPFPYNTYDLFEVEGKIPSIPGSLTEPKDNVFRNGSISLGAFRTDGSINAAAGEGVWQFGFNLKPGEQKTVHFFLTSSARGLTAAELRTVKNSNFNSEMDQRVEELESLLGAGMQIEVPDPTVARIFKAQILHAQSQILQAANRDYRVLVQGFQGVWPWEVMKFAVHWDSIGHHEDVRKCLEYFLQIQGRFPPHGDFKNSDGVFGGTIAFEESGWENDDESTLVGQLAKINAGKECEFPNWMNGTGAMLFAFGTHFRYTRDREWLQRISSALVCACDWIINERQETKKYDSEGKKVLHYGLLPIGRAYDTAEEAIRQLASDGDLPAGQMDDRHAPLDTYYPCWTDSYSSQGLSSVAEALAEIGHPEGVRLLSEAEDYRKDILELMRRTRASGPALPPYPERLYRPPAWAEFATGSLAYLDTGFLDPKDEAFEQLENHMKGKWNRGVLGLTGGMEKNGDPHGNNSFYVNFSEDIWHRGWLLRGEVEKALLAFYSMLAFGLDKQTLATVERFHLSDERYAPFFMDTSASARVCGLIRQALLFQQCEVLHLLRGVPRLWLADGEKINIIHGVTMAAKVNLRVSSQVAKGKITIELELSKLRPKELTTVRLRVPHPSRRQMKTVSVNGIPWVSFSAEDEIVEVMTTVGLTEIVVNY